jgi:hypothetical protein
MEHAKPSCGLSIRFPKAYYHDSQKEGYTKPISLIRARRARQ